MTTARLFHLGVAALVGLITVTGRPPAADAELVYTASVTAWGIRVSETIPGGPAAADTLFDGGGPTAGAGAASSGSSSSFASFPYPGPVIVSLPSLLAGSIPQARLPNYPFYVEASHPTNPRPDPKVAPGGTLSASAGPSESFGYAGAGIGDDATALGHFEASAAVTRTADSAVATGASVGRSIRIGPLEIASLTSTATATLGGDGDLVRDSTLAVTGMTVDGQGLAVVDGAIVLADTRVPLAESGGAAQALAGAGVEVAYLAAQETATGLTSSALAVSRRQETPGGLQVTVNFILGQVVASIDGGALSNEPVAIGNEVGPPGPEQSAAEGRAPDGAPVQVAPPSIVPPPVGPPPSLDQPVEAGARFGGSHDVAAGPARADPPPESQPVATAPVATVATVRRTPWSFDTRSAYLLMAAAVAGAVALEFIFGRRRRGWNS